MPVIEVEPQTLAELGAKLEQAADVAGLVGLVGYGRRSLVDAPDCGLERVNFALAQFLEDWAHGCGHLRTDARTLAGLLTRAGAVYLDVEAAIAGTA